MSSLADKVAFARKHWGAPGKESFEIEPGGWLYDHYWKPAHSFRLWPVDPTRLCDDCRARAGSLTLDYYEPEGTRTRDHEDDHDCKGLQSEIIQFILVQLKRQSGKTVGTSGLAAAKLYKDADGRIAFISGSEDQSKELFKEHYADHVTNNPALRKRSEIVGNRITVARTGSRFVFLPTSMAGATGGTMTTVIIDEARNVPAEVAVALIHTILAQSGWICPNHKPGNNHTRTKGDLDEPKHRVCGICKARLVPWAAQIFVTTSAGEIKGTSRDWFFELVEANEEDPHPRAYVHVDESTVNAKVAASVENAIGSFLGKAESLRTAVDIESHNIARKRGEDVITQTEIKRCSDRTLGRAELCREKAVGFCDIASTIEKCSVVIMADDTDQGEDRWDRVYIPHLTFWDPKKMPHGVIDEKEVEAELDHCVRAFPNLTVLHVDTRGCPWAVAMVKRLRAKSPHFRKVIRPWNKNGGEDEQGWIDLEVRYRQRTIRHPLEPEIGKEARGLMRKKKGDRLVVDDINRQRMHKDIMESMAMCCYLVIAEASIKRQRLRLRDVQAKTAMGRAFGSKPRAGRLSLGADGK